MNPLAGAIDCDVHPAIASMDDLLPFLDGHWADAVRERGIGVLQLASYPPNLPFTVRPDWRPADSLASLRENILDRWELRLAICNCLFGVQLPFSEDMGAAFARGVNNWMAATYLDREPRLRASIVVAPQNPAFAAAEIERCAADPRFVQVLLLAMGDMPLGRRAYWPIYEAAVRHHLPIGIHAGSAFRHPVTGVGWPGSYYEEYADQPQGFQGQLASLICEGVFTKFPALRVVLIESGVTWLPAFLWRLSKLWRGIRTEIPWVDCAPDELVRRHVRLTTQPFDAPSDPAMVRRILDHLGSNEMLLFASDYPHHQFDGDDALPAGLPADLYPSVLVDNSLATYPRLQEVPC
jgi:predicted TIM-barrel fold metal-dependent hydrolase